MPNTDKSFRAAADECRRLAAKATGPVERQELNRVAEQWLKLTQAAGAVQEPDRSVLNKLPGAALHPAWPFCVTVNCRRE